LKRLAAICVYFSFNVLAQQPNTDIWLFKLSEKKGNYTLLKGENITKREGYDNQPSWDKKGERLFFVSVKEDKQSDVYVYEPGKKKITQFTKTTESEYSPTLLEDAKRIACVVVEKDSTQRIWTYDAVNGNMQAPLINEDSVGYFHMLNGDTVIYYKLTEPHSLRVHQLSSKKDNWLCNTPVRGFKKINAHSFVYGIKDSVGVSFYRYEAYTQKATKLTSYPSLSEDIIWHLNLGLLKSEGSKILKWSEPQKKWDVLFDFAPFGVKRITRFTFDPKNNYIAIVDNL
jgi:hypothetical protein